MSPRPAAAYLNCKQEGTRAKYGVSVVDQAAPGAYRVSLSNEPKLFSSSWGWRKFLSHVGLRSRPGYLAGDRLVLRATVEVVP